MTKALEKKIITTVRRAVAESIHDVLSDLDRGLGLSSAARSRLSRYRRKKTHRLTSFTEARRRLS